MFEKDLSLTLLYDLYAPLLSQKKREVFEAYYLSDLSLSEISEETGTSRQAVRDLITRTAAELREWDQGLELLKKRNRLTALCDRLSFEVLERAEREAVIEEIREMI